MIADSSSAGVDGSSARLAKWDPRKVFGSFRARHSLFIANGVLNVLWLTVEFIPLSDTDPRKGVLVECSFVALLCVFVGAMSLASSRKKANATGKKVVKSSVDWHFRLVVLLQSLLLTGLCCMLTIPFEKKIRPDSFEYLWSCKVNSLCPQWCRDEGGNCSWRESPDGRITECNCIGGSSFKTGCTFLAMLTSLLLCVLTIVNVPQLWRVSYSWIDGRTSTCRFRLAVFSVAAVSGLQCTLSLLTSYSSASCQSSLAAAFASALPLMPLSLLANEALWVAEAWKPERHRMLYAPVHDVSGLHVFVLCSVCCELTGAYYSLTYADSHTTLACSTLRKVIGGLLIVAALASAVVWGLTVPPLAEPLAAMEYDSRSPSRDSRSASQDD